MSEKINIDDELKSKEYKEVYEEFLEINNSILRCLAFTQINCSQSTQLRNKLYFLSMIDDILQSIVAIKMLASEGIRNSCRRELRYLIELSIKACLISQKYSEMTVEEQIEEYAKILRDTNISMIRDIKFYFFKEDTRQEFINDVKKMYGYTNNYVHSTSRQVEERFRMIKIGRTIGLEGINELKELNSELYKAYSYVIVLLFHAIPSWSVGDFIVESDGSSNQWFFKKSRFIAEIDSYFDYKHERKEFIEQIKKLRIEAIEL